MITVAMFWDFGSAVSQRRPAATEATAGSAAAPGIGKLLGMPNKTLRYIVSGSDTLLKSTSESADRENTHEFLRGNFITVGTERFRCTGTRDKSLQSIMKCHDDIQKNLHDDVMSFNDADAMMTDQYAV